MEKNNYKIKVNMIMEYTHPAIKKVEDSLIIDFKNDDHITQLIKDKIFNLENKENILKEEHKIIVDDFDTYGEWEKQKIMIINEETLKTISDNQKIGVHDIIKIKMGNGDKEKLIECTCIRKENDHVILDFNHPLSGKHFNLSFNVLEIIKDK